MKDTRCFFDIYLQILVCILHLLSFSGDPQHPNYFSKNTKIMFTFFHRIDFCIDDGKPAATLSHIKTMAINLATITAFYTHNKKTKPISLKKILDEKVQNY